MVVLSALSHPIEDFKFDIPLIDSRYKNIPQMSFDDTGREPDQAFRLNRDPLAELEYPTK